MGNEVRAWDPGTVTLGLLRRYERQGRKGRREFLTALGLAAGGAHLFAQQPAGRTPRTQFPPQHSAKVMEPVNVHEIAEVAGRSIPWGTFEYINGGAEDEYTLIGNLEAYTRTYLRRRVMVDVSKIDTSLQLLGQKLAYPIMLDPTTKNRIVPEGDKLAAIGAKAANAIYGVTAAPWMNELNKSGQAPIWWCSQLGQPTRELAQDWARRNTELGSTWLGVAVDHTVTPNRDRNIRNGYPGYEAGVLMPGVPNVTWDYINWVRGATKAPIIVKGILNAEDAAAAVKYGADAIIVSNHGGRAYDGAVPSLMALPECVDAVGGKIPVLLDGGIRRGGDVLKALALGAKAVLVGRPPAWGLAAFGAVGVQRVMEMLAAEFTVAMALAGAPNLAAINRSMVRLPWENA
jgi:isopentenyl diphosphate isomerase/L-lactate dehydrogenase-like FMN-dependent dehydrogenase